MTDFLIRSLVFRNFKRSFSKVAFALSSVGCQKLSADNSCDTVLWGTKVKTLDSVTNADFKGRQLLWCRKLSTHWKLQHISLSKARARLFTCEADLEVKNTLFALDVQDPRGETKHAPEV